MVSLKKKKKPKLKNCSLKEKKIKAEAKYSVLTTDLLTLTINRNIP